MENDKALEKFESFSACVRPILIVTTSGSRNPATTDMINLEMGMRCPWDPRSVEQYSMISDSEEIASLWNYS